MKYKCLKCGFISSEKINYCPNCGESFSNFEELDEINDQSNTLIDKENKEELDNNKINPDYDVTKVEEEVNKYKRKKKICFILIIIFSILSGLDLLIMLITRLLNKEFFEEYHVYLYLLIPLLVFVIVVNISVKFFLHYKARYQEFYSYKNKLDSSLKENKIIDGVMFYKCPKCGNSFIGQKDRCSKCNQEFKYDDLKVEEKSNNIDNKVNEEVNLSNTLSVLSNAQDNASNSPINQVFNVLWVIFIGLWAVIYNFFLGITYCLSLIGIPAGIMCFKFIPIVFKPGGRELILDFKSHPFLNTIQFIFGGLISYISCLFFSLVFAITIVGIPISKQLFKISRFFLAPFGSKMVYINQYSENKDTVYDLCYFLSQVYYDNKKVKLSDGRNIDASKAMKEVLTSEEKIKLCKDLDFNRYGDFSKERTPKFINFKYSYLDAIFYVILDFIGSYAIIPILITLFMFIIKLFNPTNFNFEFSMDWFLKFYSNYKFISLIAFIVLFFSNTIYFIFDIRKYHKLKKILMPIYLSKWKNITTYYSIKVDGKLLKCRKNKNFYSEKSKLYQQAPSINEMVIDIISVDSK